MPMTKEAREFVRKKTLHHARAGKHPTTAAAMAYDQARAAGYDVPKVPMRHRKIKRL